MMRSKRAIISWVLSFITGKNVSRILKWNAGVSSFRCLFHFSAVLKLRHNKINVYLIVTTALLSFVYLVSRPSPSHGLKTLYSLAFSMCSMLLITCSTVAALKRATIRTGPMVKRAMPSFAKSLML